LSYRPCRADVDHSGRAETACGGRALATAVLLYAFEALLAPVAVVLYDRS
jgi:hypothetical protein